MRLCMEDINAAQNGKQINYLESSERHQMQRHSSTQIVIGMPNRQQDTGECTSYRELWQKREGNKTKSNQPNKN